MAPAWASVVSPAQTWAGATTRSVEWSLQSHKNISPNETRECRNDGVILARIGRGRGSGAGREPAPSAGLRVMRSRTWRT